MKQYDFIIAGAGCAGLSLAVHLANSTTLSSQKILLIDKAPKNTNDRTWCFWETSPGLFEKIIFRRWQEVYFKSNAGNRLLQLYPFEYKMIRGIDFYEYAQSVLKLFPNVDFYYGDIQSTGSNKNEAWVIADNKKFEAEYLFNSLPPALPADRQYYYLQQHFKGWVIETDASVFDDKHATLMDFRVSQQHGTTFAYVLPFSANKALVEYTLFSAQLLFPEQYNEGLKNYLHTFYPGILYQILEEEFGVIPMTNYHFPAYNGREIYIGTAGGQTKASTGFTFAFIQKHSKAIVDALEKTGKPYLPHHFIPRRFHWYDSTLLHILSKDLLDGEAIFSRLFLKNNPAAVLRFLENTSSLAEELKLTTSLQRGIFIPAAIKELFR